jgi:adenylosuccinate synthase
MQFGSCGKGLFAGFLARKIEADTIVTAWAPNAGHTFIDADGFKMVSIALPNGIVSKSVKRVLLGPGSLINPNILMSELECYAGMMHGVKLMIHENAGVISERHRTAEAQYGFAIGSTMKGVGEAFIQKIKRDPKDMNVAKSALVGTPLEGYVVSTKEYNDAIDGADTVLLEGAQGFSLSINQGFYPYVTSRDCTVNQLMSDCAIPHGGPIYGRTIHGVCRTYPIRVANRHDKDGNQIGTSGPCYPDQRELKWSDIGMEPELTTVTRLPRRIFTFSAEQIRQAVRMNGINNVFLNFANYPMMQGAGASGNNGNIGRMVASIQETGAAVRWLGYGPSITDIKEL